jgi:hypothetical protein
VALIKPSPSPSGQHKHLPFLSPSFFLCGLAITLPFTIATIFLLQLLVHIKQSIRHACSFLMKRNNKTSIAAELAVHSKVVQGSALYQHSLSLRKLPSHVVEKQQPYAENLGDPGSVLYYVQQGAGHSNHLSYLLCRPFMASFSRKWQPSAV